MSHWNYRIIERDDGYFGLREVYYTDDDQPTGHCSADTDAYDSPEELIHELRTMLKDAKKQSPLHEREFIRDPAYDEDGAEEYNLIDE